MEYKRVLLKLSGEALKNGKDDIVDFDYVLKLCNEISKLNKKFISIGIVVGGGNIWRGRENTYIDSESSDRIGILGTSINALILKSAFDKLKINACVYNSFDAKNIIDKVPSKEKLSILNKENIIIFGGGTGKVGCSTDTAAALYANLIDADVIIKLTNVDGIYNMDPNKYTNAKKYDNISFDDVIDKDLSVMDLSAIKICRDNNIEILVTNINSLFNVEDAISKKSYSIVKNK